MAAAREKMVAAACESGWRDVPPKKDTVTERDDQGVETSPWGVLTKFHEFWSNCQPPSTSDFYGLSSQYTTGERILQYQLTSFYRVHRPVV